MSGAMAVMLKVSRFPLSSAGGADGKSISIARNRRRPRNSFGLRLLAKRAVHHCCSNLQVRLCAERTVKTVVPLSDTALVRARRARPSEAHGHVRKRRRRLALPAQSKGLVAALARCTVSQVGNLRPLDDTGALPIATRRNSRLPTCATVQFRDGF